MTPAGRPPLPPGKRKTERLQLFYSPDEMAQLKADAEERALTVAEYVRRKSLGRRTR